MRSVPSQLPNYRIPVILEPETMRGLRTLRGSGTDSPCFQRPDFLEKWNVARKIFEDLSAEDSSYEAAALNLAATHILKKEGLQALPPLENREGLVANHLRILAMYFIRDDDELAVAELERLYTDHPEDPALAFNLAMFYRRVQRAEDARRVGQAFLEMEPIGPFADRMRPSGELPSSASEPSLGIASPVSLGQPLNSRRMTEIARVNAMVFYRADNGLLVMTRGDLAVAARIPVDAYSTSVAPIRTISDRNREVLFFRDGAIEKRDGEARWLWFFEDSGQR